MALSTLTRLGLIDTPPILRIPDSLTSKPGNQNGAQIVSVECCRALLTHRSNQHIDLFVPEHSEQDLRNNVNYLMLTEDGMSSAFQVMSPSKLPQWFENSRPTALHTMAANELDSVVYARNAFSPYLIPVTCMQYGFTYQHLLRQMATRLLLVPTYPCDALVVSSQAAKEATTGILDRLRNDFERSYNASLQSQFQVKVVPHGVPVDIYMPRDKIKMRQHLELPLYKTILLYVGRIDPTSKADIVPLLLSMQQLRLKHGEKIFLVLAGPIRNGYKPQIDVAIAELGLTGNVIFRDDIPRGNVPLYYSAADIFVSLSDTPQENFGLTPVEAMASGLPVVVSDWAAYKETVIEGETGFKVPTTWAACDDDLNQLAPFYEWTSDHFYLSQTVAVDVKISTSRLDLLISDEQLRLKMGERARQHVVTNYSWERCVRLFWDMWDELQETALSYSASWKKPPSELMRTHYFEDFGHFATQELNPLATLRLTARGQQVCANKQGLLLSDQPRGLFQKDLIIKILRLIRFLGSIHYPMTVQDIDVHFARKRFVAPNSIMRHIMWSVKYDLIQVVNQ